MAKSKTFPEVWASLDVYQRRELKAAVLAATMVSEVAFWQWAKGERKPRLFPVVTAVTDAVNRTLGTSYTYAQLFPINS